MACTVTKFHTTSNPSWALTKKKQPISEESLERLLRAVFGRLSGLGLSLQGQGPSATNSCRQYLAALYSCAVKEETWKNKLVQEIALAAAMAVALLHLARFNSGLPQA
eukprot:s186_g18.t1